MPSDSADFTGRMATVTGWGRLKYGGGVPSVLQEVQVCNKIILKYGGIFTEIRTSLWLAFLGVVFLFFAVSFNLKFVFI